LVEVIESSRKAKNAARTRIVLERLGFADDLQMALPLPASPGGVSGAGNGILRSGQIVLSNLENVLL
jgi:hypothetical protein